MDLFKLFASKENVEFWETRIIGGRYAVTVVATLGVFAVGAVLARSIVTSLMPLAPVLAGLFSGGAVHIGTLESVQAGLGTAVLIVLAILVRRIVRIAERTVDSIGLQLHILEAHTKAIEELQQAVADIKKRLDPD